MIEASCVTGWWDCEIYGLISYRVNTTIRLFNPIHPLVSQGEWMNVRVHRSIKVCNAQRNVAHCHCAGCSIFFFFLFFLPLQILILLVSYDRSAILHLRLRSDLYLSAALFSMHCISMILQLFSAFLFLLFLADFARLLNIRPHLPSLFLAVYRG